MTQRFMNSGCVSKLILLCASLCLAGCVTPTISAPADNGTSPIPETTLTKTSTKITDKDLLRVGISANNMQDYEYPEAGISATGAFNIKSKETGEILYRGQPGAHVTLRANQGKLALSGVPGSFPGPLEVEPVDADFKHSLLKLTNITRRGHIPTYRGTFEIGIGYSSPNRLSVVNILPIQDYLRAVVPNELPAHYGYEAVKAQSVAARNYALRPREKAWPQFDICDSQYCQVYFGAQTETPDTNKALEETSGLVGLYDGDLILALYSSAHGGYQEDYSNVFSVPKTNVYPAPGIPYLSGGPDLPDVFAKFGPLNSEEQARSFWTNNNISSYDVLSPYHRWEKHWSAATIQGVLNQTLADVSKDNFTKPFITPLFQPGNSVGVLKRIHVKQRGISGKAMEIEIEGTGGRWTVRKEFVIRKVFLHNGRMLPSANVVFSHLTDGGGKLVTLKVNGGGFGHGVGMSQLGASWMGKHGFTYDQIIQHYYKGISIGSIPLTVGKDASLNPLKVSFYVKKQQGRLWVESEHTGDSVTVELNGVKRQVDLSREKKVTEPLYQALHPGALNTLILYPDAKHPERRIKAWVELFPSKPAEVAQKP